MGGMDRWIDGIGGIDAWMAGIDGYLGLMRWLG